MALNKKHNNYDESTIHTLDALEHIRLRPGMYVGRLGNGAHFNDGIYILVKEIIDNSVDEFIMGNGHRIEIKQKENKVSVRDFGRGIPLGKIVDCVSIINTGAKYNDEVFQFSVGLNGVGTKAVNALSSFFMVRSFRDGKMAEAIFKQGNLQEKKVVKTTEPNGTFILFEPDQEIFGDYKFNDEFIQERMMNYAYLNTGLTLNYNGSAFKSQKGLFDLLTREVDGEELYPICHYKSDKLEFAFTHLNGGNGENYFSYVNGQHTTDGGTHLAAFKEGVLKGINDHFGKAWSPQDVREGIVGAIAIKLQSPIFESQTKNKLGNTEIRTSIIQEVKTATEDFLLKNSEEAENLNQKILFNERIRKEFSQVKKVVREANRKISLNIPKLKDCKYHLGEKGSHQKEGEQSMIFLTEGDSASGTITKTRNVATQAVYSLRGKILNVCGKTKASMIQNTELFNLIAALGIENGLEGLRYDKIVIATDADTDGYHIRNLIMTFFLTFYEDIVLAGKLYILETPLFRVRNKKNTGYCYSEKQRDNMIKQIKNAEVTRFKGLGEIDPREFGQFIGDDIKLIPVTISTMAEMRKIVNFYMGNNTPERRDYIMENLI